MATYDFFENFLFRAPRLPLQAYNNIDKLFISPEFQQAVFLASEDLYNSIQNKVYADLTSKQKLSVLKYAYRMCNRCTPFGTFAGTGVGSIGLTSAINIAFGKAFQSITSLDNDFFMSLSRQIDKIPDLAAEVHYFTNSGIFKLDKYYRYTERSAKNGSFVISQIPANKIIRSILSNCKTGRTKNDIEQFILENNYCETSLEACEFITELVDNEVIISEFYPGITKDNLQAFAVLLERSINSQNYYHSHIAEIVKSLSDVNLSEHNKKIGSIHTLEGKLRKVLDAEKSTVVHSKTNCYIRCESATISSSILDMVKEGTRILNILNDKAGNSTMDNFTQIFYERYDHEEIPLTEVLDPDVGIQFGKFTSENLNQQPLGKNIFLGDKKSRNPQSVTRKTNINSFLLKKYFEVCKHKKDILNLTAKDFLDVIDRWDDLPQTFSVGAEVIQAGNKRDPLILMKFAGGYSANCIPGRFSFDWPEIGAFADEIASVERKGFSDDSVIAEIAYLPDDLSYSKILSRKNVHKFEIPIMCTSSLKGKQQILLSDLFLSVDRNHQLILRSKSLGKKIITRNSSADAYHTANNPYYHFLSAYQGNRKIRANLTFDWKFVNPLEGYFPRITYENNIILAPAKWIIDFKKLDKENKFIENFTALKQRVNIPDKVYLRGDTDNNLLIDFNKPLSLDLLISQLKRGYNTFEECFDFTIDPLVTSNGECYANELIFSLYKITNDNQKTANFRR